jgi:hypothetical protein
MGAVAAVGKGGPAAALGESAGPGADPGVPGALVAWTLSAASDGAFGVPPALLGEEAAFSACRAVRSSMRVSLVALRMKRRTTNKERTCKEKRIDWCS